MHAGRRRARLSLLAVLALLLAGAVSPFGAVPASAAVLVSTIEQTLGSTWEYTSSGTNLSLAQGYTTGKSPLGYILSSIEVRTDSASSPTTLRAELWSAAAAGGPGAKIADLSSPTSVSTSGGTANAYAAPSNTRLATGTKYFVVLYKTDTIPESVKVAGSTTEDAGGEPDWSIDDKPYRVSSSLPSGTWMLDSGHNLMIRVNGSAVPWANLRVTPGDRRLTLTWTGPSVSGDTAIRGYDVWYREAVCTQPKRWNAGSSSNPDWVPEFRDGVRVYEYCDANDKDKPGPWIHHGAWAGSWDPIARQTTRVIDGLWPGVAYDVRMRVRTTKLVSPYVLARGTPSGGSSNARLLQIQLIADQLQQ